MRPFPSALPDPFGARACIAGFLLLALPMCLWFALRTPIGEVADEPAHLMRAASLVDGQLVAHRQSHRLPDGRVVVAAGVTADPVWEALSQARDAADLRLPARRDAQAESDRHWSSGTAFFPLYTIGTYCPVFYLPAAIGLAAGRGLGLGPSATARLGRVAAVLAYAILGLAALALAARGRILLFGVLALPMSLSLAGSFNQDGLIIAAAVLAAALVTRGWEAAPSGRLHPATPCAALLIALIVLAKPPYAPLAALLVVPVGRARARVLRSAALACLAILPGLIWGGWAAAVIATPVPRPPYEAGPLWPGPRPALFQGTDPGAQVRSLLADPTRLLTVPATYLLTLKHALGLAAGAIGILGWLDRPLPLALYPLWVAALAGAALALDDRAPGPRRSGRILLALAALAGLWGIVLSQYLTWTDVGSERVDGPQGRYLLPLLPLLIPWLGGGLRRRASVLGWLPYLAAATNGLIPWV